MSSVCDKCEQAHNGLNGRYCNKLKRYVEHSKTKQCETKEEQV